MGTFSQLTKTKFFLVSIALIIIKGQETRHTRTITKSGHYGTLADCM